MVRFLFSLPPVAYFVIAAMLVALGFYADNENQASIAERALALKSDAPAVVSLGEFTPSDDDLAKEVNVAAQINIAHMYTLNKDGDNDPNAHLLYMLFDPASTAEDRIVKAAVVIPAGQKEDFAAWINTNVQGYGPMSPVFAFNGTRSASTSYSSFANDRMRNNGFTRAPGFFYLKPFMQGRAAEFSPRSSDSQSLMLPAWFAALVVAIFGGLKMLFRRRRKTYWH